MKKTLKCLLLISLAGWVSLSLLSCASQPNLKKENEDFLVLVKRAKRSLSPTAYKDWLIKQKEIKQAELQALSGVEDRENRLLDHNEVMKEGSANVGGPQDVHGFKADRSRQNLKRMEERRSMIRRHLFHINSQLSSLEPL